MSLTENTEPRRRRQSRRRNPETLGELLVSLHQQYPRATETELKSMLRENGKERPQLVDEALDFWSSLNYRKLIVAPNPAGQTSRPQPRENIEGSAQAARVTIQTIFDTFMIGGKPVGEYTTQEAIGVGRTNIRHGYILLRMARVVANPDPNAKLRNIVKLNEAQRIIKQAIEESNVA